MLGQNLWIDRLGDPHSMGFTVSLTEHHCHGRGRLPPNLICGDCNSADGAIKRKLGLPAAWSFSPAELDRIVRGAPHAGVAINYASALAIYEGHRLRFF